MIFGIGFFVIDSLCIDLEKIYLCNCKVMINLNVFD